MHATSSLDDMPLRVLMATTSFPSDASDWKGRFIFDLAAALSEDESLSINLWGPPGLLPTRVSTANSTSDSAWLERMSEAGGIAHMLRKRPVNGLIHASGIQSRLRGACRRTDADLYHINWLQLALGLPADSRPAYVSVLGSDYGLLRLPGMTRLLRRTFARRPTMLAPNADWMKADLEGRFGGVAEVRPNPFGVLTGWFEVDRAPKPSPEWLVVSRITRRKLGSLPDWGNGLFGNRRTLRLLGPMQESISLPRWVKHEGSTDPGALRQRWFPRSTGLLTLSRHDEGRPQVMIEAMAAGLPVIASRIPAHEDLIRHGETGWLVDNREELAEALLQAEDPAVANEVGGRARAWVHQKMGTWDDYASRCVIAYRDLLNTGSRRVS